MRQGCVWLGKFRPGKVKVGEERSGEIWLGLVGCG